MTLLETERSVRKISAFLGGPKNQSGASKLAEDFATACRAANLRLHQCEAMVKAGDRHQAIQSAETAPNLLDLVTVLEFQGSDEWRRHCQENGLPIAEAIDGRGVECLNECYSQGIATDHPLYAAYRQACLLRNDEQALKALQTIIRLNPSDTNASSELDRLDGKVLQSRLRHLEDLLAGGSPELMLRQVEAIEEFGFKHQPAGAPWQKAQAIRCEALLGVGDRAKASGSWLESLAQLDLIQRLQTDNKLELGSDLLRRIAELEAWASGEHAKDQRDREFQSQLTELRRLTRQAEEAGEPARQVGLAKLKQNFESLRQAWRALEGFARPIPDATAIAFRKCSALIEAEILRRTSVRKRAILTGVAAALLLAGLAGWFVLAQRGARELARQLDEAVAQRKVRTAEKLLASRSSHKGFLTPAALSTAAAGAETLVGKERNALKSFEDSSGKLPKTLDPKPTPAELARVSGQLAAARAGLEALSPDLKAERESELRGFEQRWEKYLADSAVAIDASIEQGVKTAEEQCDAVDYRFPLEQARGQLTALSNQVYRVDGFESGFTNHLKLRSDLLQRAAVVRAKFAAFDAERNRLDEGFLCLQNARGFGAYAESMVLMASSKFSSSPLAKAATTAQAIGPSDEAALCFLLGATNAGAWAFLKKDSEPRFVPENVSQAEQAIFAELAGDPAVSATHQHIKLWLDEGGSKAVEWITAGPLAQTVGWRVIKAYEPQSSPATCVFSSHDYGFFDGKYKLSPTQPVYRIEQLVPATEAAAFHLLELEGLGAGASYNKPLLQVLDALKDSREGSPLFRAYLYLRVVDIMELQPESWGLAFAPSITAHRGTIKAIVDNRLDSGDWFITAKASKWGERLDQFFDSAKPISYAKQAAGLLGLARETAKSGFQYVGFVGLDGKAVIPGASSPSEIWGYTADRNQPALLGNKTRSPGTISRAAVPLSPLFKLATPRSEILIKVGINPNAPPFAGVLPALITEQ